ncbi:SRPBCC family protein [Nocardioides sp. LHG3406-4]|uniref:SRPBCC family protein n=1 Tax=Nocardioides sp. LHG3406-4 TaxID=2804575 RepID=UPI003CF58631
MATFELSRSARIDADPGRVHALIDDFREWPAWSPWEDVDPDMQRSYTGRDRGVGAHYHWQGNSKAGSGDMEITESSPARIAIDLSFLKPFKAAYLTTFTLAPTASGTVVTWSMGGERNALMSFLGKVYFDKAVAKDFDRGLARLKAAAES